MRSPSKSPGSLDVRFWNRVPVRFGFAALVIFVTALAILGAYTERQQHLMFVDQRKVEAVSDAAMIALTLTDRMMKGGGRDVWNGISGDARRYAELTQAARIAIFAPDGQIKVDTDGSLGQRIAIVDNPECPLCNSQDKADFPSTVIYENGSGRPLLRVVNPVAGSGECRSCHRGDAGFLGMIAVDFDLTYLERQRLERQSMLIMLGLGASAALSIMTAWAFRKLVMRPITALSSATDQMAAGHLDVRASISELNEVGSLALHFNHMADRIQEQFDDIEMANTESQLFYTLVVEASKNLETIDMIRGLHKVLREKLSPQSLAVVLEEADGHWVCMAGTDEGVEPTATGEGGVEAELAVQESEIFKWASDVPVSMINLAATSRELRILKRDDGVAFALPLAFSDLLIGMVICRTSMRLDARLLNNLKAHLSLAAGNARNYTGAMTDTLTHLHNKRYGMARLQETIFAAQRYPMRFGLVMCDIDHFKRINDVHGHVLGDAVIREVSRRIKASVRKSDVVVRYGGEEFMIIVPETRDGSLSRIGEKIRAAVSEFPLSQAAIQVTVSVGATEFRPGVESAETLIERADRALYRAKEAGRNSVMVDENLVPRLIRQGAA